MSARMRHSMCPSSQYPVLKVHAPRLIRSDRAARQGDILPDCEALWDVNSTLHKSYTIHRFLYMIEKLMRIYRIHQMMTLWF